MVQKKTKLDNFIHNILNQEIKSTVDQIIYQQQSMKKVQEFDHYYKFVIILKQLVDIREYRGQLTTKQIYQQISKVLNVSSQKIKQEIKNNFVRLTSEQILAKLCLIKGIFFGVSSNYFKVYDQWIYKNLDNIMLEKDNQFYLISQHKINSKRYASQSQKEAIYEFIRSLKGQCQEYFQVEDYVLQNQKQKIEIQHCQSISPTKINQIQSKETQIFKKKSVFVKDTFDSESISQYIDLFRIIESETCEQSQKSGKSKNKQSDIEDFYFNQSSLIANYKKTGYENLENL